jgi:predicted amidohydrolase
MTSSLAVAAVQLSSQDDVARNLERARALGAEAARRGAQLVVLPENFAFMGDEAGKRAIAESVEEARGPIVAMVRNLARESGVWVVAGGMPERSDDVNRPYNTSLLVSPGGDVVSRYRKIHLFDVETPDGRAYRESEATRAGASNGAGVCDAADTKLGMTICYDVRFPELYRKLTSEGALVVTVPSAFTLLTGKDHWHALLRARAIENQLFVVAAAQQGTHPKGRQTYGKSLVVDPWGDVLAQCGEGEGFCIAHLDFAYQARVRASLPCLSHRTM